MFFQRRSAGEKRPGVWQLLITFILIHALSQLPRSQALEFSVPRGIYLASYTETETVSESENIVDVGCTDSAGVPLDEATYNIVGGNSEPFSINQTTGQISWGQTLVLDYETTPFYLFTISCEDTALDIPSTATAQVNVSLQPVNEFLPEISPSQLVVIAQENTPEGTILVSTLPGGRRQYSVMDRDDGPDGVIEYSLNSPNTSENIGDLFRVDPLTGELSLSKLFDVDNIPTANAFITVRITACDTTPRDQCPNLPITIIIQSAADNDPMFEEDSIIASISEDTSAGSVLTRLSCSDRDMGVGEYGGISIANVVPSDAADFFRLDSMTDGNADLILLENLDYEVARLYNITVRCFDNVIATPAEDFARVYITVEPINDEPPQFDLRVYSFAVNRISASGVDIGQVVAIDRDLLVGGEITYSIISGDESNFGLRVDGMVYLKDFVFAFEGDTFPLVVMASDGTFNDTTEVIITVSGFLSIPEIVIIILSATVLVVMIVVCAVIICCCCYGRCRPGKNDAPSVSNLKLDMIDGRHTLDYVEPRFMAPMPMVYPVQYEPVQSRAPTSVFQNWGVASQDSPSESENDEVDQASIPKSNSFGPVLHEVVEHFKEGDKMIIKNKKDSKSEKE